MGVDAEGADVVVQVRGRVVVAVVHFRLRRDRDVLVVLAEEGDLGGAVAEERGVGDYDGGFGGEEVVL